MIDLKLGKVLINGRDRIRISIVLCLRVFGGNELLGF